MNWLSIATLGPIGYLPASGTCATLASLVLVWLLSFTPNGIYISTLLLILLLGGYSAQYAVWRLRHPDPSCVVIDECAGTLITFLGCSVTVPVLIVGTLLFRLLDITKWVGIRHCEQLPRAWGVMMDDIAAGMVSCCLLHLLRWQGIL